MNDLPRRRSPDGFDDDAIFADIVAHLNDDVGEPERARPAADAATTDIPTTDAEATDTAATTDNPAPGANEDDAERSTAESTPEATELRPDHTLPDGTQPADTRLDDTQLNDAVLNDTQLNDTQLNDTQLDDTRPDDTQPDDGPTNDPGQEPLNQPPGLATAPGDPRTVPPPQVWRAHAVDDEYEEHFDPPPVSALPVGDLQFWAIIAGMGGGPLLLLYLVFFNRDASGYWILAAIAMSVAGFALLVSRMPGHHEDDDDGARL